MSEQVTPQDNNMQTEITQLIAGLKPGMHRQYDRNVNRDLSQQNPQGVFRRNVLEVLNEAYTNFLQQLAQTSATITENSSSQILQSFDSVLDELLQFALQKHRSSCALSNFPEEHNPSHDYIEEVLGEIAHSRQTFVTQLTSLLQNK